MHEVLEASQGYADSSRRALEQLTTEHQELLLMLGEGVAVLTPVVRKWAKVKTFKSKAIRRVRSVTGTWKRFEEVRRLTRNVEQHLSHLLEESLSRKAMGLEQSIADVWVHLENGGIIEVEQHLVKLTGAA